MDGIDALHSVNYNKLVLNKSETRASSTQKGPPPLIKLACQAVVEAGLAAEAMITVPAHLAEPLLREAIVMDNYCAASSMMAYWPLYELCFRDILPENNRDIFTYEMCLDIAVFKGFITRTRYCKIRCIDLRGLLINQTFAKLIVQMWPLLCMKKYNRNVKKLVSAIGRRTGIKTDSKLYKEILPQIIRDLLFHEMMLNSVFQVSLPRGEKVVVKLDRLVFSTCNTFFMDYLISHCTQGLTPVEIQVSKICIRSDLSVGDEVMDSLAPFIVFRGHDVKMIEGISIENLEETVIFITSTDIRPFTNLTALALPSCNITLRDGGTRSRTSARHQITETLRCFRHLRRLDLQQNCFAGCLPELLDSLHNPLEYLNLCECDLFDSDIEYLSQSKHAASLKQLDLSRTCGFYFGHKTSASAQTLLRCVPCFKQVVLLEIEENHIEERYLDKLSEVVLKLKCLKGLNVANNLLKTDSVLKLIETVASLPSLQQVKIPYYNILGVLQIGGQGQSEFEQRVKAMLANIRRTDLRIDTVVVAFSVLIN